MPYWHFDSVSIISLSALLKENDKKKGKEMVMVKGDDSAGKRPGPAIHGYFHTG